MHPHQSPLSAATLELQLKVCSSSIEFHYIVDGRFIDVLTVTYPFELTTQDHASTGAMGLAVAVFIAQLCRARHIRLGFAVSPEMIEQIKPLAEMLYDIRCWKDGIDYIPFPEIEYQGKAVSELDFVKPFPGRASLLFSGGKDSTLSAVVLGKNNWDIQAVHIPANAYADATERKAVRSIGSALDLDPQTLDFSFPGFATLARAYAITWDKFPHYNAVPFGRDMLLGVLACPMARHNRSSVISVGHDHNCRLAHVNYLGKRIARNDVESAEGALLLGAYIQRFLCPDVALLPPVARLTEYRILWEMFVNYSDLMKLTSYCFWGRSCGRCAKCLRYYLVERVLKREGTLSFAISPLQGDASPELEDYFLADWDNDALFSGEVAYCLARLVERGDIRPGETKLKKFADQVFNRLSNRLETIEKELMAIYPDSQVPEGFIVP